MGLKMPGRSEVGDLGELMDSPEGLMGIIASATDAIITVDDDQKITLFNAAAERMFDAARATHWVSRSTNSFLIASGKVTASIFGDLAQRA